MMRLIAILLSLVMTTVTLNAQNQQQEINTIKSNPDYLYATGTSTTSSEEASDNARDLLALEIEQWLTDNAVEAVESYVAKSRENLSQIHVKRGNLYRVFAYVKKADIMQLGKEDKVIAAAAVSIPAPPPYQPTIRERLMLNVSTFNELNDYVNAGREDGSIVDVGKYSNLPQTGLVYVFIHNPKKEIPACMKVTDGKALNLRTGREDRIADYRGCGAIWIKFNEE